MKITNDILLYQRNYEGRPKNCEMQAISIDRQKGNAIALEHISK